MAKPLSIRSSQNSQEIGSLLQQNPSQKVTIDNLVEPMCHLFLDCSSADINVVIHNFVFSTLQANPNITCRTIVGLISRDAPMFAFPKRLVNKILYGCNCFVKSVVPGQAQPTWMLSQQKSDWISDARLERSLKQEPLPPSDDETKEVEEEIIECEIRCSNSNTSVVTPVDFDRLLDQEYLREIAETIVRSFTVQDPPPPLCTVTHECMVCHKPSSHRCGYCMSVHYCSRPCQLTHWKTHKLDCVNMSLYDKLVLSALRELGGCASVKVIAAHILDPDLSKNQLGHVLHYLARKRLVIRLDANPPLWKLVSSIDVHPSMDNGDDSFFSAIRKTPAVLNELSAQVKRTNDLLESVNGGNQVLGNLAVQTTTLTSSLNSIFKIMKDSFSSVMETTGLSGWMSEHTQTAVFGLLLMTPVFKWGLNSVMDVLKFTLEIGRTTLPGFIVKACEHLAKLFTFFSAPSAHSAETVHPSLGDDQRGVASLFAMILMTFIKDPKSSMALAAMRNAAPVIAGITSVTLGMKYFISILPTTVQKYLTEAGLYRPFGELSHRFSTQLSLLAEFESKSSTNTFKVEEKVIIVECYDYVSNTMFIETAGKSSACCIYVNNLLQRFKDKIDIYRMDIQDKPRPQPLGLYLFGPAGQGKSTLINVVSLIRHASRTTHQISFSRPTIEKYWSGWNNEPVIVYDDPFQGGTEQIQLMMGEIIRVISPVAIQPPQAAVNAKGKPATPELIIVAANNPPTQRVKGIDPGAFFRRFIFVDVQCTADFKMPDGTANSIAILAQNLADRILNKQLTLQPMRGYVDARNNIIFERDGPQITLPQLMQKMDARVNILRNVHLQIYKDLQPLRNAVLGIQEEGVEPLPQEVIDAFNLPGAQKPQPAQQAADVGEDRKEPEDPALRQKWWAHAMAQPIWGDTSLYATPNFFTWGDPHPSMMEDAVDDEKEPFVDVPLVRPSQDQMPPHVASIFTTLHGVVAPDEDEVIYAKTPLLTFVDEQPDTWTQHIKQQGITLANLATYVLNHPLDSSIKVLKETLQFVDSIPAGMPITAAALIGGIWVVDPSALCLPMFISGFSAAYTDIKRDWDKTCFGCFAPCTPATYLCMPCFRNALKSVILSDVELSGFAKNLERVIEMLGIKAALLMFSKRDELKVGLAALQAVMFRMLNPIHRWTDFCESRGLPRDVTDLELTEAYNLMRRYFLSIHTEDDMIQEGHDNAYKRTCAVLGRLHDIRRFILSHRVSAFGQDLSWFMKKYTQSGYSGWKSTIVRNDVVGKLVHTVTNTLYCEMCKHVTFIHDDRCSYCYSTEDYWYDAYPFEKVQSPVSVKSIATALNMLLGFDGYATLIIKNARAARRAHTSYAFMLAGEHFEKAGIRFGMEPNEMIKFIRERNKEALAILLTTLDRRDKKVLQGISFWNSLPWDPPIDPPKDALHACYDQAVANDEEFSKLLDYVEGFNMRQRLRNLWDAILNFKNRPDVVDILKFSGFLMGVYALYRGVKYAVECFFEGTQPSSNSDEEALFDHLPASKSVVKSGARSNNKVLHSLVQGVNDSIQESVHASADVSPQDIKSASDKIARLVSAICFVTRPTKADHNGKPCIQGIGGFLVGPKQIMLPAHFFYENGGIFSEPTDYSVSFHGISYTFKLSPCDVKFLEENMEMRLDMAVIDLTNCCKHFNERFNVFNLLLSQDEQFDPTKYAGFFFLSCRKGEYALDELKLSIHSQRTEYRAGNNNKAKCYVPVSYSYQPKGLGYCGALICGMRSGGEIFVLGYHVADRSVFGRDTAGVGMPLVKEQVATAIPSQMSLGDGFLRLDRPVEPRCGPLPNKTAYQHSLIAKAPFLQCVTREPALLGNPNDTRADISTTRLVIEEVRRMGAENYNPRPYPEEEVRECFEGIRDQLFALMRADLPARLMTESEVLNGSSHSDKAFKFLKPIAVNKSSGWPWCTMPGVRGKRPFVFGDVGQYVISDPAMRACLDKARQMLRDGSGFWAVICFLKDELRSRTKIEKKCTRVIQCFDMVYCIIFKEYFGAFINFVHATPIHSGSAVGINPLSQQWTEMVDYLYAKGTHGFDGDYTKFEAYLTHQLCDFIVNLINDWYTKFGECTDDDRRIRHELVRHMLERVIIVDNTFWIQTGGLASGVPGTTAIFGFLMNMFFMRYAWMHLAPKGQNDQTTYALNVALITYGDDNISAVARQFLRYYNFNTVQKFFASIGVVYTTPYKEITEYPDSKPILDLQFLKCTTQQVFGFGPGIRYLPIPNRSDVLPTLKWVRNGLPQEVAVVVNSNDVLRRCCAWSDQEFELLRTEITDSLHSVGITQPLLTKQACVAMVGTDFSELVQVFSESAPRSFTSLQLRDGFSKTLSTILLPDYVEVHCSMLAAPDSQDSVDSSAPKVVVERAAAATDEAVGGFVVTGNTSILELCKRHATLRSIFDTDGEILVDVSAFMLGYYTDTTGPQPAGYRCGLLHWYSRLFAFWWGDMRLTVNSDQNTVIGYYNLPAGYGNYYDLNMELNISNTNLYGVSGSGNSAFQQYGLSNGCYQLPCVSQYRMLANPKTSDQTSLPTYNSGTVAFHNPGTNLWALASVAAGETFNLTWQECVPRVQHINFTKRKNPRKEHVHPSMDNITFAPVDGVAVSDGDKARANNGGQRDVGEVQMTFADFATRSQYVTSGVWTTSTAVGDVLFQGVAPTDFLGGVNIIPFQQFVYFRGGLRVQIKLQSQPYQQGRLICIFNPNMDAITFGKFVKIHRPSQTIGFNTTIYAGGSRDITIRIPFIHVQSYINLLQTTAVNGIPPGWGLFNMICFNALAVGADAAQDFATWSLFASFENPDFDVLRPRTSMVAVEREQANRERIRKAIYAGARHLEGFEDVHPSGMAWSTIQFAGNVARAVSATIDIGTQYRKNQADLDYPAVVANGPKVSMATNPDITNIKQVYTGRTLGLTGHDGNFMTCNQGMGETTLGELAAKPTIYATFNFTDTAMVGDTLFSERITICPAILGANVGPFAVPNMEYVSLPFEYWKADIHLRLEVIGTKFHTGRLAVVTCYGQDRASATIDEALSQYAHIFDVSSDTNTMDFVFPYKAVTEMLRISHANEVPDDIMSYICGSFQVVVLESLQYPSIVANTVTINAYLYATNCSWKFCGGSLQNLAPYDPYYVSTGSARGEDECKS